jgi:hypothetical protein
MMMPMILMPPMFTTVKVGTVVGMLGCHDGKPYGFGLPGHTEAILPGLDPSRHPSNVPPRAPPSRRAARED